MLRLIATWVLHALALLALPLLLPSIKVEGFVTALIVVAVLGLINMLIRPLLILLTLPVTILTLGLFILVINAVLFQLVAHLVPGFSVGGFWPALVGSIIYSVVSWLLAALLPGD